MTTLCPFSKGCRDRDGATELREAVKGSVTHSLGLASPSQPQEGRRAGSRTGGWCQLKTRAFLFLVFIPTATLCPPAADSKSEAATFTTQGFRTAVPKPG